MGGPSAFEASVSEGFALDSELVHPAKPDFTDDDFSDIVSRQYRNLIGTVLNQSRRAQVPRRQFGGLRASPLYPVRATMRSRVSAVSGQVIGGRQLLQRSLDCARRVIRKEVIFALGRSGQGSRAPRRRRTARSFQRC